MITPFTLPGKINRPQQDVLQPLYTMHAQQEDALHQGLLVLTGRVMEKHRPFPEEIAANSLTGAVFRIVKLFGGAARLSEEDFRGFTSSVNEGGLRAMVTMLLAADKEKTLRSVLVPHSSLHPSLSTLPWEVLRAGVTNRQEDSGMNS